MTKRIEIYSTQSDAAKLLSAIEAERAVRYAKVGVYDIAACPTYCFHTEIPNLGRTSHPDRTSSDRYMIFPNRIEPVLREVIQNSGSKLYMADPWKNPPCLQFTCGGIYDSGLTDEKCVIAGLIETAYKDNQLDGLFAHFSRIIRRCYKRIRRLDLDSYVGPEALGLLSAGWRFTESLSSPSELDLKSDLGD